MRALIVAGCVIACTRAEPRRDPDPIPTPRERVFVVVSGAPRDPHVIPPSVSYLAVRLPADPAAAPKLDDLGTGPAHRRPIASQEGERWVHAFINNRIVVGAVSPAEGKPTYEVTVPVDPKALLLAGDALFVGSAQAVGWVDLAASKPAYVELVKRTGYPEKAYDLLVRDGDRLVAIDDEVMPMYADWFALDPSGRPTKRLGDWKLPGVINGHYELAALLATAADEWTLYLTAPYGIMSGYGHDLVALPIRGDKLVFDAGLTLQNRDGKTPIVEEHVSRDSTGNTTLLGGTKHTWWTGIAIARGAKRLLLAAGERGVISLPTDFPATGATATTLDLGGVVHDVRDLDGLVMALVDERGKQTTTLVILDPSATRVAAKHDLRRTVAHFVR